MTNINSLIKDELLNRTKKSKLYLMTNIDQISKACGVHSSEVTLNIQKLFLSCDPNFTYDLSETRNGAKIVALQSFKTDRYAIECLADEKSEEGLAYYMLSQFNNKINTQDIERIMHFYKHLLKCSDGVEVSNNVLFFAMTKEKDRIYKQVNKDFVFMDPSEIDEILDLILTYGYSFEKNGYIFWKTYSPNANISNEDATQIFTVIKSASFEEKIKNKENNIKNDILTESIDTIETQLTINKAFSFLAKELGITLNDNKSKNKLEEMVTMTNELIMSFNDLPDWEKLKSWESFMNDWQTIMGEAVNDRN